MIWEYVNLKVLNLSHNQLDSLDGDLFQNCKNLENLYFEFSSLRLIDPTIFDELKSLKEVNLLFNRDDLYSGAQFENLKIQLQTEFEKIASPDLVNNLQRENEETIMRNNEIEEILKQQNEEQSAVIKQFQHGLSMYLKKFAQNDENYKDLKIKILTHTSLS